MNLIVLRRFERAWEAHIAKGRLSAEGIPAVVTNEHFCTANWTLTYAIGLIELRVPESEVSKANLILQSHESGDFTHELNLTDNEAERLICGSCGHTDRERMRNLWTKEFWAYVISWILFGVFWPSSCWKERCGNCGSTATL